MNRFVSGRITGFATHTPERALMSRIRGFSTLAMILILPLGACSGPGKQLGGTDIPVIPELTHVSTTVSNGSTSRIQDGTVVFEGPIYDALERARWSVANFRHSGWVLEAITGTPEQATATFGHDKPSNGIQRVATLDVTADRRKGTAVIHFSTRKVGSDSSSSKDGSVPSEKTPPGDS